MADGFILDEAALRELREMFAFFRRFRHFQGPLAGRRHEDLAPEGLLVVVAGYTRIAEDQHAYAWIAGRPDNATKRVLPINGSPAHSGEAATFADSEDKFFRPAYLLGENANPIASVKSRGIRPGGFPIDPNTLEPTWHIQPWAGGDAPVVPNDDPLGQELWPLTEAPAARMYVAIDDQGERYRYFDGMNQTDGICPPPEEGPPPP